MQSATFEVILTHEHTDFDALASMLAASLIFPDALPILPRQLNRNVSSFLVLYRNRLPFLTYQDLPRGRVARAILVDTRAANWVKGMDDNSEILVVDHHSVDQMLPAGWQVWSEPVGANTTLLVEKLRETKIKPSAVQATLLALGIHEDTGSLTYPSTTQRDAAALTWLLEPEHNVNQEVVGRFLHHPLSATQRELLQTLIDSSEFLEIAGHTIVIAQAQAAEFQEEISALATRLRDFHETDAVFLVIGLEDIVQVVARSTTDEIDVGAVARELGGGGHSRAAAAPVHGVEADTQAVRNRLVALVREHSRAAVTVHKIMSWGRPQALSPDMTISEAATLMRRYGHEGFPVLKELPDGREELLGVLTRREADRALNHNLGDEPVSRFMRAGKVTIHPDSSVPLLRKTMIDSNWGQIPVVDDSGRIVGIVTRTDLIKLWDDALLPERRAHQVAQKLRESLPPLQHALLRLVGDEVSVMNYSVYVVGGFVRDLLLNQGDVSVAALDMDIVIEGDAIHFAHRMQSLYGGRVVLHRRFGTAKWLLDDAQHPVEYARLLGDLSEDSGALPNHLDFVTARTEFYTAPTVLPTVESSSIKLDLHRRDFTINTLALCLNPDRWGELLDFYGGLNDLSAGVVRVLHSLSFVDDPTRILRAVRYEQRFDFVIDDRTLELMNDALDMLERVTPARIRHELDRILQEEMPEKMLARLDQLGILAKLHPDLHVDKWIEERFAALRAVLAQPDADPALTEQAIERLYWGILVYRLPRSSESVLAERLNLRGETQRLVQGLAILRKSMGALNDPQISASQAVDILDRVDPSARALASVIVMNEPAWRTIDHFRTQWQRVKPDLNGDDLSAMGIPHGPIYRRLLRELRTARLDGRIDSRSGEIAWVNRALLEEPR